MHRRFRRSDLKAGILKGKAQRDLPCKPDSVSALKPMAVILLGRRSRAASSHLPAARPGPGHAAAYLVLLPVEIARFTRPQRRLVSVALIRASRRAAVSCYGALRSPDFPPAALLPPTAAPEAPAAGALLYPQELLGSKR